MLPSATSAISSAYDVPLLIDFPLNKTYAVPICLINSAAALPTGFSEFLLWIAVSDAEFLFVSNPVAARPYILLFLITRRSRIASPIEPDLRVLQDQYISATDLVKHIPQIATIDHHVNLSITSWRLVKLVHLLLYSVFKIRSQHDSSTSSCVK